MKIRRQTLSIIQLQVLIWIVVLLLMIFSLLPMDGLLKSAIFTAVNATSYAIIIYGNILFLYPVLFERRRFVAYGISVALFLIIIGMLKGYAVDILYRYVLRIPGPPADLPEILSYVPGGVLIYVQSLVFFFAFFYFTLQL